jgi:hypothetical protein
MCLQTATTIATIGLKVADGVMANRTAKADAIYREQQAHLARQTAAINAQRPLDEGRERLGAYLARAAQAGVDTASGSPVDAAAKIAERAQRNHLTALHGGEVAAWEHKIDAANARVRGANILRGAVIGAGLSLLGEASRENWFGGRSGHRAHTGFYVP